MGKNRPGGEARGRSYDLWAAQSHVSSPLGSLSEIFSRSQNQLRAGKRGRPHAKNSQRTARGKISGRSAHGRIVELRRLSRRRTRAAPASPRSAGDLRRIRLVAEKTL